MLAIIIPLFGYPNLLTYL